MVKHDACMLLLLLAGCMSATANTCSGNLLSASIETGCALDRCSCWPSIATCDHSAFCDPSPDKDGNSMCQGVCQLTSLGILLNTVRWFVLVGCLTIVIIYHFYRSRRRNAAEAAISINNAQGNDEDGFVEQIQERHLMRRLRHLVSKRRKVNEMQKPANFSRQISSLEVYTNWTSPQESTEFAQDTNTTNQLNAYIDITQLYARNTHGGYVIKFTPQIYLETMHKNVLPFLLASTLIFIVLTIIFTLHSTTLTSVAINLGGAACTACTSYTSNITTAANIHDHLIDFGSTELASSPSLLSLSFHIDNRNKSITQAGIYDFGQYSIGISSGNVSLGQMYSNKLVSICSCNTITSCDHLECSSVALVGIQLKRFHALVHDVRSKQYKIEFHLDKTMIPLPSYSMQFVLYENQYDWLGHTIRIVLGTTCFCLLFHFLYVLRHRDENGWCEKYWNHLSIERKGMVVILVLLIFHFNPFQLVWIHASGGAPGSFYFIFQSIWETLLYACAMTILMFLVDSYRKDCRYFSNGISMKLVGKRFLAVKIGLLLLVVSSRLGVGLGLDGKYVSGTMNQAQILAILDTVLILGGLTIFLGVAASVHRTLQAQRYSETRYLVQCFRYLSIITYSAFSILLFQTITSSTASGVSTAPSVVLPTASVVAEMSFTLLMMFAVVAFYPPTPPAQGARPRGYVLRERRQFVTTPQEDPSSPPVSYFSSSPGTNSNDSVNSLGMPLSTSNLLRTPGFRAKHATEPHHLFCLETACLMFNCSRYAYYRGCHNLAHDKGEDGKVKFPASQYVNQASLARDNLHEVAHIHDEITDTHCLVFKSPSKVIFAFRGTASKQNIKTDLEMSLESVKWLSDDVAPLLVHRGFLQAYETVRLKCHEIYQELRARQRIGPTTHVYCTGHSLGGALATLAAVDFKWTFQQRVIMYNYGCPRVGTRGFHDFFNAQIPLAFRVVNEGDIICGMPPRLSVSICTSHRRKRLYQHVGTEVVMDGKANGDFIINPTFAEKNLILEVRKKPGRHLLSGYKEKLDVILQCSLHTERSIGEYRRQNPLEHALYGMDTLEEDSSFDTP